jgi:hypothetical protein
MNQLCFIFLKFFALGITKNGLSQGTSSNVDNHHFMSQRDL